MSIRWKATSLRLALGFAVFLALISPAAQAQCPGSPEHRGTGKPNIVFVLTDDQDLLLDSLDYMPNLKALLADPGTTFSNNFVPLSLCCPSRTTILRGQYPHNHKVVGNLPPEGGFQKAYATNVESATIATDLRSAGYRTILLGKYLNGYPDTATTTYIPPGWDEWYSPVGGDPYGEFKYKMNENGSVIDYGSSPSDYLTDVIRDRAVNFLNRAAQNPDKPFFVYFATFAPHEPATPAPRHANLFPGLQAPRRPSFNEADVGEKPAYIQAFPLLADADFAAIDDLYRRRIQSLQAVDEAIAALVQALQSNGQLDKTYLFFMSDNAFHMGEHRLPSGKYTPYETDIRVPLLVRGPGVPAGATVLHMTSEVDLAATFAEIAGVQPAATTDGRSLVPLFAASPPPMSAWRQACLIEQFANGNPLRDPAYARLWWSGKYPGILEPPDPEDLAPPSANTWPSHTGYETPTYKYLEYGTGERELYLLTNDPDEMENMAASADPGLLGSLSGYLATLTSCAGQDCIAAESKPVPQLLSVEMSWTPEFPTELTPVTFTATATGSPPFTYAWDLGGTQASGASVAKTFSPGPYAISVAVQDGIGALFTAADLLKVVPHVTVSAVSKSSSPFRLTLTGEGFQTGCTVKINGTPAPKTLFKGAAKVVASGDKLGKLVPKGATVQITVANPDGGESPPFPFTR